MQTRRYTSKSDVYSLGIVLWEIFTYGRVPHAEIPTSAIIATVISGAQLRRPFASTPDEAYNLMLRCTSLQIAERPTTTDVRRTLEGLAQGSGALGTQNPMTTGTALFHPRHLLVENKTAMFATSVPVVAGDNDDDDETSL
jgi:serine/threonine protein kinase